MTRFFKFPLPSQQATLPTNRVLKLPAAQQFQAQVSNEVLPSNHRHNLYANDELLNNDEFLEHAITTLRAKRAMCLAAEQAWLETTPKVSSYDVVLQSDSLLTTTSIAKDYGLSAKRLNQTLCEECV